MLSTLPYRACQGANEAVDTLLRDLRGENITRMQFWSAKALLDLGQTVREDDTVTRIERLEHAVEQRHGACDYYDRLTDAELEQRFQQVKEDTLNHFTAQELQDQLRRLNSRSGTPGK